VVADPSMPVSPYYAKFSLSQADLAQMDNDEDKACVMRANMMHVREPSLTRCADDQVRRLKNRVQFSYANTIFRLPVARRAALQNNHRNWEVSYVANCKDQLNIADQIHYYRERFPMLRCEGLELYRRALWLERYR
jgi:hypothetical protein